MAASTVKLDMARQVRLRDFTQARQQLTLLRWSLIVAYALLWLVTGLSTALRDAVDGWFSNDWLRMAAFGIAYFVPLWLLQLPLVYRGYALIKHYALGDMKANWRHNYVAASASTSVLSLFAVEMIYSGLRDYPNAWWSLGGAYIIGAAVAWYFSSRVARVLLHTYELTQDEELSSKLPQLVQGTKAEVSGVYRNRTKGHEDEVGAWATKRHGKPTVTMTEAMANEFTPAEIKAVMAHEVGHHAHLDSRWLMIVYFAALIMRLYLTLFALGLGMSWFGITIMDDLAALPLFALLLACTGALLRPLLTAFSRWRERKADEYALHKISDPQTFAQVMIKFANRSYYEANPDLLTRLFLTHPSYHERIAKAELFAQVQQTSDERWRLM